MHENTLFGQLSITTSVMIPSPADGRPPVEKLVVLARIPCQFGDAEKKLAEFREANPRIDVVWAKWTTAYQVL